MNPHDPLAPSARSWLQGRGWAWDEDADTDGLVMEVTSGPSDQAWRWYLQVREEHRQVALFTILDRPIAPDLLASMSALAVRANFGLTVGGFELDTEEGQFRFRTSVGFGAAEVGEEQVRALLDEMERTNTLMVGGYWPAILAVLDGRDGAEAVREVEGR